MDWMMLLLAGAIGAVIYAMGVEAGYRKATEKVDETLSDAMERMEERGDE